MGGRSRGGSVDTTKSADATMDKLSKGRISNERVMGLQDQMAGNQLAKMIPMFEAMMNQGMGSFNDNPIFGGQGPTLGWMPKPPDFSFGPVPGVPQPGMSPDNRTGGSLGNLQQVPGQPVYQNDIWQHLPGKLGQIGPGGVKGGGQMSPQDIEFMLSGGKGMIPRGRQ